jgi:hypothetical protein
MNEIILAPCDVISKSKQNSSDMNEIILAPCDAGYVQSCTGYSIWFNFSAAFFISEKKTGVIKLKIHFIHLVPCHEMLIIILNC